MFEEKFLEFPVILENRVNSNLVLRCKELLSYDRPLFYM